jgi:hypothetical protein
MFYNIFFKILEPHNLGFFHKRKIVSWETGPEVLLKIKNQPTQKITNEGC